MTTQRISQWLAIRCKEAEFQRFLGAASEPDAISKVRALGQVKSRAEFDADPEAAQRFHEKIRHPFIDFTTKEQRHV